MRQVGLAGEAGAKQHRGLAGEARMGGEIRGVFASEIQSLSWGPCLEAILATDIHPWKVNRLVGYRAGEMLYKGEAWPVPVSDPSSTYPLGKQSSSGIAYQSSGWGRSRSSSHFRSSGQSHQRCSRAGDRSPLRRRSPLGTLRKTRSPIEPGMRRGKAGYGRAGQAFGAG